ncbi:MAG: 30S ribosomal protein S10 [Gammaproteobacteria bacterium]
MAKKATAQKFRIRLNAFDYRLLDQSTENIVNAVKRAGAEICGPVPLPVRRRRYDLLRSPHKDKTSREQLEIREHGRFLDITDISSRATNALTNLDVPAGVHVDIKVLTE